MKRPDRRYDIRSPQAWLELARSDLSFARGGREMDDVLPEPIAFHVQQCAEKALKAVLISRNVHFPPTHNLQVLVDLCEEVGLTVSQKVAESVELTPYAVEGRYLGLPEPIAEPVADHAIAVAESVLSWAEEQIMGNLSR